jgi:hypothetical protein
MKAIGKIAIGAAGVVTAALLLGAVKARETYTTGMQLAFRFRTISKIKLNTSFENNIPKVIVTANLSIFVDNPTDTPFDVNGFGMATLKEVAIKDGLGKTIAIAKVDIPQLSIPAQGTIQIDNIPIAADGLNALQNIQNLSSLTGITITGKLEALGTTFTV